MSSKKSGKVSCSLRFWKSVFDDFRPHKAVACWFLILAMAAILTLRSGEVHPHPGPVTERKSKSQDATPSASCNLSVNFCSGCGKDRFRRMDIHQRSCKCALSMHCHLPEVDTDGFTTSGFSGHAMTDQHGSSIDRSAVSNYVRCPVCQSFFSNN